MNGPCRSNHLNRWRRSKRKTHLNRHSCAYTSLDSITERFAFLGMMWKWCFLFNEYSHSMNNNEWLQVYLLSKWVFSVSQSKSLFPLFCWPKKTYKEQQIIWKQSIQLLLEKECLNERKRHIYIHLYTYVCPNKEYTTLFHHPYHKALIAPNGFGQMGITKRIHEVAYSNLT